MINLDSYTSVRTSLFVRLQIDEYRITPSAGYSDTVLRFSDHFITKTIDSEDYVPLGELLNITKSASELKSSANTISITISGIPTNNIAEILHSKIKGCPVKIYRAYFDTSTNAQIGTTQVKFIGSIDNFSFEEEIDAIDKSATNTINFECVNTSDLLSRKISGRKTNPESMKKYFASDTSFDRVPNLEGANYNFGVAG